MKYSDFYTDAHVALGLINRTKRYKESEKDLNMAIMYFYRVIVLGREFRGGYLRNIIYQQLSIIKGQVL